MRTRERQNALALAASERALPPSTFGLFITAHPFLPPATTLSICRPPPYPAHPRFTPFSSRRKNAPFGQDSRGFRCPKMPFLSLIRSCSLSFPHLLHHPPPCATSLARILPSRYHQGDPALFAKDTREQSETQKPLFLRARSRCVRVNKRAYPAHISLPHSHTLSFSFFLVRERRVSPGSHLSVSSASYAEK